MWRSVSANHEINVEGQVRNKTSGRILKPYLCGKYHGIRFEMNGKKHYIHHLVAEAFLPNPTDDECVVDHIDLDKLHNDFKQFHEQYDHRRGKNFKQTFPVLTDWYNDLQV